MVSVLPHIAVGSGNENDLDILFLSDKNLIEIVLVSSIPESSDHRRREQVRNAQRYDEVSRAVFQMYMLTARVSRTHRQRTFTYITELENEVLRLRTSESNALARVDKLQADVRALFQKFAEHRLPVPAITRLNTLSSNTSPAVFTESHTHKEQETLRTKNEDSVTAD
jgi:hypothetical protein